MGSRVFFRNFDRDDFIAVASLSIAQIKNNPTQARSIFRSIEPGDFQFLPGSLLVPDVCTYDSPTAFRVTVQGTSNPFQLAGEALQSGQGTYDEFTGSVIRFFANAARAIIPVLDPIILPALGTKQIGFVGHSLGGAVAQLLCNHYAGKMTFHPSVLTIGCPRVGNSDFAAWADNVVVRVENTNDLVPAIPPAVWAGPGSNFPLPGPGLPAINAHGGKAQTLHLDGSLTDGSDLISLARVAYNLSTGYVDPHYSESYLAALQAGLPPNQPTPGDEEFSAPALLNSAVNQQLGADPRFRPPGVGDEAMASNLVQGLLFFRDKAITAGWSEACYFNGQVPTVAVTMQGLAPERAKALASDIEIHAVRAARVGGPKESVTSFLIPPVAGVLTEACNEPGDALLYTVYAGITKRVYTFRGVPDGAITGGLPVVAPNPAADACAAYITTLVNQSGQIKIIDPANSWFPCTSIANGVGGGPIIVKVGGFHGLVNGDVITLRGIRNYPYLLGRWKVGVIDTETIQLIGSERYVVSLSNQGEIIQQSYAGTPITRGVPLRAGHHETGRPFGLLHGRSAAKVLHH